MRLKIEICNSITVNDNVEVPHMICVNRNFCFCLLSLSTTSNMDCQLLRQKFRRKISVIKTINCVFVVFKAKRELKCQNELFL